MAFMATVEFVEHNGRRWLPADPPRRWGFPSMWRSGWRRTGCRIPGSSSAPDSLQADYKRARTGFL